jgi:CheY-like chemotaxis protein
LWEQVLRDPALEPQMRTAALDAIQESASGQSLLVGDLLDVSRAINGKLHIEKARTPISRVLSMAVETARSHASARRLEVAAQLGPDLGDVLGDSRRLRQIFDNLLTNAIKCTETGQISVQARQSGESIVIEVSDTGRGISAELLPHIFEPFKQGDDVPNSEGLGLGLSIARELVELHGGTLCASSDGLGHGARFTVCLPRAYVSASDTSDVDGSIAGVRVLVVDDDSRLLEAVELLLRRAGAVVTTAESAAAAYALLEQGDIDVVLSDLGLRGEDGYFLVRRIRATPGAMQAIPVIAVTARSDDESRQRALAAGFDRYLPKPIEMPRIVSTIAHLVHR